MWCRRILLMFQGNKGAVSIRFNLYGVSMCVVNAHLAAHDHMLDERIKDFEKIVDEHKFHVKATPEIFQHEYVDKTLYAPKR